MATLIMRDSGSSSWLFFILAIASDVAAHGHHILGMPMIGGWIGGIEFEAAFEFFLSLLPLPIVKPQRGCQRRVGFAEIRVELQGRHRGCFAFRERVLRRQIAVPSEEHVGFGHTSVGESVAGVLLDRLLKVADRFVEPFFRPSVPMMTAL